MLRIHKSWQFDKNRLVWSLQDLRTQQREKIFLEIIVGASRVRMRFLSEKPAGVAIDHAFNQILRKQLEGCVVSGLFQHQDEQYLSFHKGGDLSFLLIASHKDAASLELVDVANTSSLARLTENACFTKRKPYADALLSQLSVGANLLPPVGTQQSIDLSQESLNTAPQIQRSAKQSLLRDQVKRRLKTLKKSMLKKSDRYIDQTEIKQLELEARLLQQFSYLLKPEAFELVIPPHLSELESSVVISLDPELSGGENLNLRYIQLKKIRRGFDQQKHQLEQHRLAISTMESDLLRLTNQEMSDRELEDVRSRHKIPAQQQQSTHQHQGDESTHASFKSYRIDGITVRVGKGGADNDDLTKHAKANDFWIHAVGASGAHVLVDGTKFRQDSLPDAVFRIAAILAIHFSKRRQDQASELYVTRRHSISKKKGMPPGLWNVEKAKTVFVRYDEEELKAALDRLEA
jgi:predicted ribosome quality control (RQC) complex YloA/Tae2 family protein